MSFIIIYLIDYKALYYHSSGVCVFIDIDLLYNIEVLMINNKVRLRKLSFPRYLDARYTHGVKIYSTVAATPLIPCRPIIIIALSKGHVTIYKPSIANLDVNIVLYYIEI